MVIGSCGAMAFALRPIQRLKAFGSIVFRDWCKVVHELCGTNAPISALWGTAIAQDRDPC